MNGDRLLGPEYIAPWRKFPQFVRYREHDWQTGEPAAYMNELNEWGLGVGEAERVEFLRGLAPIPNAWNLWAVNFLILPSENEREQNRAYAILCGLEVCT